MVARIKDLSSGRYKLIKHSAIVALALLAIAGVAKAEPMGKLELKNAKGETVTNEFFKNKNTVFVISQTACAQCRKELLELTTLREELAKYGDVYVILVDQAADRALEMYNSRGYPFPVLLDSEFTISDLADVKTTPTTLIFNKNFEIVKKYIGYKSQQGLEYLEELRNIK